MNFKNECKEYIETERYVWKNCEDDILKLNQKILRIVSILIITGFSYLLILSFVNDKLSAMMPVIFLCLLISLFIKILSLKKYNLVITLLVQYLLLFLIAFNVFCSTIILPFEQTINIMVALIFLASKLIFDKRRRVYFSITSIVSIYITLVIFYNGVMLNIVGILNIFLFTVLSMFLGSYLRHLQYENILLKDKLFIKANMDPLTKLNNRGVFSSIERSELLKEVRSVIMVDLDNFKKYNDTYGHQKGDECLIKVSNVFKKFQEKYNMTFYRYGGEEFTAIVWNKEEKETLEICNELIDSVYNLNIEHEKNSFEVVTISIGFANYDENETKLLFDIVKKADDALYKSKEEGRNRVTY